MVSMEIQSSASPVNPSQTQTQSQSQPQSATNQSQSHSHPPSAPASASRSSAPPSGGRRNVSFPRIPKLKPEEIAAQQAAADAAQQQRQHQQQQSGASDEKSSSRRPSDRTYVSPPYTHPDPSCPNQFGISLLDLTNPKHAEAQNAQGGPWTEAQQIAFEAALRKVPKGAAPRWSDLSAMTGRTPDECKARFQEFEYDKIQRALTAGFISEMGQRIRLTPAAIATACVYLQVFFTRFSFRHYDRWEVAACCLFLAGKVEERRTRVDAVVQSYFEVRRDWGHERGKFPPPPDRIEALRQKIYSLEFQLLDAIQFSFEIKHPYPSMDGMITKILGPEYAALPESTIEREMKQTGHIAQIAWFFINQSTRTTLCLRYAPDTITVALIALAIVHTNFNEPMRAGSEPGSERPWHEELFGVDRATVDAISQFVLAVVQDTRCQVPKPPQPASQSHGHSHSHSNHHISPGRPHSHHHSRGSQSQTRNSNAQASQANDANRKRNRGGDGQPKSPVHAQSQSQNAKVHPNSASRQPANANSSSSAAAGAHSAAPDSSSKSSNPNSHANHHRNSRRAKPSQPTFAPLAAAGKDKEAPIQTQSHSPSQSAAPAPAPAPRASRRSPTRSHRHSSAGQPQFTFSSSMPSILSSLQQTIAVSTASLAVSLDESKLALNPTYSPSQSISALISSPSLSKASEPHSGTEEKNLESTPMRLLADMDKLREGLTNQENREIGVNYHGSEQEDEDMALEPAWKRSRVDGNEASQEAEAEVDPELEQFGSFTGDAFDPNSELSADESRPTSASPIDRKSSPQQDEAEADVDADADADAYPESQPMNESAILDQSSEFDALKQQLGDSDPADELTKENPIPFSEGLERYSEIQEKFEEPMAI